MSNTGSNPIDASEDVTMKAVTKRYEALVAVRTKAVSGKGAWYWAHLDPVLIRNPDTNAPKAVKLKCTLCNTAFSASNPSRTASEHLKSGMCPNFSPTLKPISQLPPLASPSSQQNYRKRNLQSHQAPGTSSSSLAYPNPINMINPSRFSNETTFQPVHTSLNLKPLVLSGGKEDLGPLVQLENSVKKLKSPKSSPGQMLCKEQVDTAFDSLADWFFELCGSISFSSLEHPKFQGFLNLVGLPAISKKEFSTTRLDSKFEEARTEVEARIKDASYFQVASDGWQSKNSNANQCLVKFAMNLPNGTRVFHKAVYSEGSRVGSEYAESVIWETIQGVCGVEPQRCVGIVSDKYKAKALRNLELQNHWMINLSCQHQGIFSLIKDFCRELPLFRIVSDNCMKIANLINTKPQVRNSFHKFRIQGFEGTEFIRAPPSNCDISKNFVPFIAMLDDLLTSSRVLNLIIVDDSYNLLCLTDLSAREVADTIQDVGFWNDVEAVHSLMKMIMEMADDVEAERPLVGQCLSLWEEIRGKITNWCAKYNLPKEPVEAIVERRFKKVYHPAWSAAFILDPVYLVRNASGKYLPPFMCLTHEQEKDVDDLVTRLVSREEAHIALMELMKWRSEGLDPLYAQAVQMKQRDPVTGKMRSVNPQSSRLVWETCLKEFKTLGKVAARLLFLNATSCSLKCDWGFTQWFCTQGQSKPGLEMAQKVFFISAHAKLKSRDISGSEEKDAEFFAVSDEDDDMLNRVLADSSSI